MAVATLAVRIVPPGSLEVSVDPKPSAAVITLAGELDVATAAAVETTCYDALDAYSCPQAVVDVAGLFFCDCAGLNALLHIHRWALARGGWVRLCRAAPSLRKVLAITGLASTLRCYSTVADACADVERGASQPGKAEALDGGEVAQAVITEQVSVR